MPDNFVWSLWDTFVSPNMGYPFYHGIFSTPEFPDVRHAQRPSSTLARSSVWLFEKHLIIVPIVSDLFPNSVLSEKIPYCPFVYSPDKTNLSLEKDFYWSNDHNVVFVHSSLEMWLCRYSHSLVKIIFWKLCVRGTIGILDVMT